MGVSYIIALIGLALSCATFFVGRSLEHHRLPINKRGQSSDFTTTKLHKRHPLDILLWRRTHNLANYCSQRHLCESCCRPSRPSRNKNMVSARNTHRHAHIYTNRYKRHSGHGAQGVAERVGVRGVRGDAADD